MSKEITEFGPDIKYLQKRQFIAFSWFMFFMLIVLGIFLGYMIGKDNPSTALIVLGAAGGCVLLFYILNATFIYYYYKSIIYQFKETEMIVRRGVFQKIEKAVPFRAVTNLAVYRSLFDRMFGIGTIRLHTAGYSGTPLPEESIEGILNYVELYDNLMAKIRPMKAMTPTVSMEVDGTIDMEDQLKVNLEILKTLKEIKSLLKEGRE
ncbi:MAG: PH domain-containing protein [Candidatus Heimdallarchaeota archaeon]